MRLAAALAFVLAHSNFAEYSEVEDRQPPPPRKLVFFVDDMSVHPQTRERLTSSAPSSGSRSSRFPAPRSSPRAKLWRHTLHMNIDKGQHQVAVGVLDGISHASGMATLAVEVK